MLFETIFSRLHVLFWGFLGGYFFLLSKYRNGGFVIEECFLYLEGLCLIKRVRRTPRFFLKKNFFMKFRNSACADPEEGPGVWTPPPEICQRWGPVWRFGGGRGDPMPVFISVLSNFSGSLRSPA